MTEIWTILAPILIADVINPTLFAFMVFAVGTDKPVANSSAALLGHTFAYFSSGIVLVMALERITERLANPQRIDFFIQAVLGLLLLWTVYLIVKDTGPQQATEKSNLTPVKAFGWGAIINFLGVPFALPYFAALDQILKAELSANRSLLILVGYNLLYALPFVIVPVFVLVFGERSKPLLQRINDILIRISDFLMPILLALVGLVLVVDAATYFIIGKGFL